jgi:hypothetical protein
VVEAHDEVRPLEFLEQVVHLALGVDAVAAACRRIGHAEAHPHVTDLVPAADLVGRLLGFEVE